MIGQENVGQDRSSGCSPELEHFECLKQMVGASVGEGMNDGRASTWKWECKATQEESLAGEFRNSLVLSVK